jgi:hypothetical protein
MRISLWSFGVCQVTNHGGDGTPGTYRHCRESPYRHMRYISGSLNSPQ